MKTASAIKKRITARGTDSLWTLDDFSDLSAQPTAKALSRLSKSGLIVRIRKGLYYYPKQTALGPSRPDLSLLISKVMGRRKHVQVFSGGTASFHRLGLTTQVPAQYTLLSNQASRKTQVGNVTVRIQGRSFDHLSGATQHDIYILDALRHLKHAPDATPQETLLKLIKHLQGLKPTSIKKLLRFGRGEPPRVRAMLGAIAEYMGYRGSQLQKLKNSLNPLTKYPTGVSFLLPTASSWNII